MKAFVGLGLGAAAVAAAAAVATAAVAPQGTYRVTLTPSDLRAVGASAREVGWNTGTWTLTFAGTRWSLRQAHGRFGNAVDRGTVEITGRRLAFTLRSADGFPHNEEVGTLTWRSTPAGLRFAPLVRPRNRDLIQILAARAWARIR